MKKFNLLFILIVSFASLYAQESKSSSEETSFSNFMKSIGEFSKTKSFDYRNNVDAAKNDFLLAQPARGKLIGLDNKVLEDPKLLYNYDKLNKNVVVYVENNQPLKIALSDFKTVEFTMAEGDRWFGPCPPIEKNELFQVLVNYSGKYNLYKKIGINLSELKLQVYYIVSPDNQIHSFKLNKRVVNEILSLNPRAKYFINSHKRGKMDETYVKDFITYLNYF